MNNIINIQKQIIGTEINSVDAKELHAFIEGKVRFNDWITRRIKKYGFTEYEDYVISLTKKQGNNATLKEYHITLDMAKELAMVENNDKGREARRYFITCEKKALELQQSKPIQDNIDIQNKNDNLKEKEKFYKDILEVIANYPDGASQRTLLRDASYSQSKKIRRWLQEQISILWDMTIIPGKCYKYVLR